MKTIYVLPVAAAIFLGSCKEKEPAIDFGTTPVAKDTTYMAKVEAPDKKVVLAEEFTGVSCPPCPNARKLIAAVADQHPGQLVIMELHFKDHPQCSPIPGYSKYDFRTDDANEIAKQYYADMAGIPQAGIDRIVVENKMAQFPGSWANSIEKRLKEIPPTNIKIKSTYDASAKNAIITVTVNYTKAIEKKQFLTVAILEAGIIDAQKTLTATEKEFEFKHTFRDLLTAITGDEFLKDQPIKDAGRVYERTFIYPVDANWKPEKCLVVAYVHNGDGTDKEVLQAAETELNGQ